MTAWRRSLKSLMVLSAISISTLSFLRYHCVSWLVSSNNLTMHPGRVERHTIVMLEFNRFARFRVLSEQRAT